MSPLWKIKETKKNQLKTNRKRPSPRHNSDYLFAQKISNNKIVYNFIEGISLFASKARRINASMTVEAAIVLPLFLFFFLNLGCAIEMIRLHGNLEFSLCDIGNRMAIYGYALAATGQEEGEMEGELAEQQENGWLAELQDIAFSYTYVKGEIVDYLGAEYLEKSPIADGVNGLQFLESEIFDGEDCFEIIVTYKVAPFSSIAGFGSFRMANRYYAHLWNGYQIPGTEAGNEQEDVVYVAENGRVYHEDGNCSYLVLSVREVTLQEAYVSHNNNGERYHLCELCRDNGMNGNVYITDNGERIHYKRDCSGLRRTVYAVNIEDAEVYQPCIRCGEN